MSRFDSLPLEVIKQYIFPCLDYEGRINLNKACLSKDEYICTRLNMEEVLKFHLKIIINKLKYNIGKVFLDLPKDEKHSYHLTIIDILMKYTFVVQYFSSLRDSIIRKYTNFADSEYYEYEDLDEKYRIINESKELLKRIESFPFICNISLDSIDEDDWSPIYRAYIPDRPDLMTYRHVLNLSTWL